MFELDTQTNCDDFFSEAISEREPMRRVLVRTGVNETCVSRFCVYLYCSKYSELAEKRIQRSSFSRTS